MMRALTTACELVMFHTLGENTQLSRSQPDTPSRLSPRPIRMRRRSKGPRDGKFGFTSGWGALPVVVWIELSPEGLGSKVMRGFLSERRGRGVRRGDPARGTPVALAEIQVP